MKNLKSKTRILTSIICFSLLAFVNISCETENEIEEIIEASEKTETFGKTMAKEDASHKMAESNRAFAHFGRKRTKSKRYIFTVIANTESINDLGFVAVEIEKKEGFIKENQTYILSLKKETEIDKKFESEDIIIDNDNIIGQELNVNITFLDSNQKPIEESSSRKIIVSSEKVNYIKTTTEIKKRTNGLYRGIVKIKNKNKNIVTSVALEIEKSEGVIFENKTYYLEYYTTFKGERYYTFPDIKFENPDIENREIIVNITLLDENKKPIYTRIGDICVLSGLSKANIKRTRLKERRNGLYKMTAEIENNDENEVAEVEFTFSDLLCGSTVHLKTIPEKDNTLAAVFGFEKELCGNTINVTAVLKDFYGDVINTFKEEVTVSSNLKVDKAIFKENSNGLYTTLITIKNDNKNEIEKISLTIEKEEGVAEKTITYDLKYLKTKGGIKYYTNEKVALLDSKVKIIPAIVTIYAKNYTEIIVTRGPRYRGTSR